MKISFLTLGCKLNYAETSTYERGFKAAGLEVAGPKDKADAYLVNTCSVTATSDAKSRNLVRKVHRQNPEAVVVVTGCSAQLRRKEHEAIEGVSRVFGCNEKHLVVSETLKLLGWIRANKETAPDNRGEEESGTAVGHTEGLADGMKKPVVFAAWSSGERTRSFLKVQDGCNNFCRYCTVPYARGESRNIPICQCVRNACQAAAEGIKEIVLTGVNTGDFGRSTGESFLDLLKALNEVEGIERYRISSIEPNLITEEIVDWIASGTKFQPHFHIPLQSGCDEILEKMGRHYDTAFYASRLEYIRNRMEGPGKPKVFFGIDVMVGLPGETDELFEVTYKFIRSIHPAFIHVFPYSQRPGTPAATMPGQVSDAAKKERVARLEELCSELSARFREENKGICERVLFESTDRKGVMEGYTGNYLRVEMPWDPEKVNTLVDVVL